MPVSLPSLPMAAAPTLHVLAFLDLGERQGIPFPPRFFVEASDTEWTEFEVRLARGELALRGTTDVQCPLTLADVRFVIKERDDCYGYRRHRAFVVEELRQTLHSAMDLV
jgi:hypothetical protein